MSRSAPSEGAADRPAVIIFRSVLLLRSETFIRTQAAHLVAHRPVFVGLSRCGDGLELGDAPTVVLPSAAARFLAKNLGWWPSAVLDRLRRERPALVHAHFGPDGVFAAALARALGVPLVVTFHGYDASVPVRCLDRPRWRWPRWMHRWMLGRRRLARAASALIAVSDHVRRHVVAQGFAPERVVVRPIGIELAAGPAPGASPAGEPVIVFVGRLVEKKGLLTLLRAFRSLQARLPAARLRIVGDGPLRARAEAEAAGLPVEFLGFRPHDEVRALVASAGVIAVPSEVGPDGDEEGLPTVLLEAFAAGRAVVATLHAGIPEAATDGHDSLLVAERDPAALATALERVLSDEDLRQRLASEAHRTAQRHDIRLRTAALEDVYRAVIAGRPPGP